MFTCVRDRVEPQTQRYNQMEVRKAEHTAEYSSVRSLICSLGSQQPHPQAAAHTPLLRPAAGAPLSCRAGPCVLKWVNRERRKGVLQEVCYWLSDVTVFYFTRSPVFIVTIESRFTFLSSPNPPQNESAAEQSLSPKQVSLLPLFLPWRDLPVPSHPHPTLFSRGAMNYWD